DRDGCAGIEEGLDRDQKPVYHASALAIGHRNLDPFAGETDSAPLQRSAGIQSHARGSLVERVLQRAPGRIGSGDAVGKGIAHAVNLDRLAGDAWIRSNLQVGRLVVSRVVNGSRVAGTVHAGGRISHPVFGEYLPDFGAVGAGIGSLVGSQ